MVDKAKKIIVICMVGTPCSGKSTWILNNREKLSNKYDSAPVIVISRDDIREALFGKEYLNEQTNEGEKKVTEQYYRQLATAMCCDRAVVILDNCHLSRKYITGQYDVLKPYINSGKLEFYIKKLWIPYLKAYMRNVRRKLTTGKWIPQEYLSSCFKRYQELDLSGFNEYTEEYL
jgi:tRNA uridine 5-carbamoylmethylation protein Kti12